MADMILPFTLPFTLGGGPEGVGASSTPPVSPGATVDVTVRLQALDGTWETCGSDRAIKVDPESLQASANEWGSDKASFNLHRSPIAIWPDIGAFSPVEIEVGGVIVWEGRTGETPIRSGAEQVINVQCAGWQYHLDDDVYQWVYVHSKLTDWKDTRSFPEAQLTHYLQSGNVQSEQGRLMLGYAKGALVANQQFVGVTLDLGPVSPGAVVVSLNAELVGAAGEYQFYVIGHDGFTLGGEIWNSRVDFISAAGVATGAYNSGIVAARRYVSLVLIRNGGPEERAEDLSFVIKAVRVFTSAAFVGAEAGVSALKASVVVKDALERATLLLSSDVSQIQPTTFAIPDFTLSKASTPREAIEAANAYHNWIAKLKPGKRVAFGPRPVDASLEIGAWSGADIEDASANNGAEIYNRAVIEATAADGSPLVVERTAGQQPGVISAPVATPAPENPSFAVNTVGWSCTAAGSAIERDTTIFNTAPASGRFSKPTSGGPLVAAFTGIFRKGVQYKVVFSGRGVLSRGGGQASVTLGTSAYEQGINFFTPSEGSFQQFSVTWTPQADTTAATLQLFGTTGATGHFWVDDVQVLAPAPTLVDRRGFRRTKVIQMSSAITEAEGTQLADIFIKAHMTTPFKGSASVLPGGVRTVIGGQPVHPSTLLLRTQELLRLGQLVDPDTGGVTREGTVKECVYTHKDQRTQVTLDDTRSNFDSLLARLAVVQSVGS